MWGVPVQLLRVLTPMWPTSAPVLTPMWPTSAPGLAQVCSYSASLIDLMGPTAPPPSVAPQVQLGAIGAAASAVLSSDEAKAELQRVRQQVGELEGSLQVRRGCRPSQSATLATVTCTQCTRTLTRLNACTHARFNACMRTRMHTHARIEAWAHTLLTRARC
jgi:hypothetical protein